MEMKARGASVIAIIEKDDEEIKKLADDYNPITITAFQSFYGLLMFLPLYLVDILLFSPGAMGAVMTAMQVAGDLVDDEAFQPADGDRFTEDTDRADGFAAAACQAGIEIHSLLKKPPPVFLLMRTLRSKSSLVPNW